MRAAISDGDGTSRMQDDIGFEKIAPVSSGAEMDWEALAAFLRERMDGLDGPLIVEQFGGGAANLTYLVRCRGSEFVVRRPPLGRVPKGGHDMRREYRLLSRLNAAFDRAPRGILYCDDVGVIGAPFLVMERREGVVVRDDWPPSLSSLQDVERRLSIAVVDALADLHLVDPAAIGLQELGRPSGFVQRQLDGWYARWEAAKVADMPVFDSVYDELCSHVPKNSAVSILHNDFKLNNCQFQSGEPDRVHSVFDWDMAALGDPLIDVGTLLNYWPQPGDAITRGRMPKTLSGQFLSRSEMVDRYVERTGFEIANLPWYEAFALWKTAVVVQQISARFHRGESGDSRFAQSDEHLHLFVEEARRVLAG